ncbi:hypothetical protein [Brevibacillus fortis]|uniref:hypothetical protein n=1 Tax=Brevibacillus fortis TaxID=2126352 RepID=UPI0038FBEC95
MLEEVRIKMWAAGWRPTRKEIEDILLAVESTMMANEREIKLPKKYAVQNKETKSFLKHNGSYNPCAYPYDDVESIEEATHWSDFRHVSYVARWYADSFCKWQIVDVDTREVLEPMKIGLGGK